MVTLNIFLLIQLLSYVMCSHPILDLHYSITGDYILVISGSAQVRLSIFHSRKLNEFLFQAKVVDRDGFEKAEFVKGDQYIADTAKTKGHIAGLVAGCWNPRDKNEFLTCSHDGQVWKTVSMRYR